MVSSWGAEQDQVSDAENARLRTPSLGETREGGRFRVDAAARSLLSLLVLEQPTSRCSFWAPGSRDCSGFDLRGLLAVRGAACRQHALHDGAAGEAFAELRAADLRAKAADVLDRGASQFRGLR